MRNVTVGMPVRFSVQTDAGFLTLPGQVVFVRSGGNADIVVHQIKDGGTVDTHLVEDVPYSAEEASGTWCGANG